MACTRWYVCWRIRQGNFRSGMTLRLLNKQQDVLAAATRNSPRLANTRRQQSLGRKRLWHATRQQTDVHIGMQPLGKKSCRQRVRCADGQGITGMRLRDGGGEARD